MFSSQQQYCKQGIEHNMKMRKGIHKQTNTRYKQIKIKQKSKIHNDSETYKSVDYLSNTCINITCAKHCILNQMWMYNAQCEDNTDKWWLLKGKVLEQLETGFYNILFNILHYREFKKAFWNVAVNNKNEWWLKSMCFVPVFSYSPVSVVTATVSQSSKIPRVTSLSLSWWWTRQSTFITLHVDFMLCTFISSQYLFAIQCFRWSFIGNILAYSYLY